MSVCMQSCHGVGGTCLWVLRVNMQHHCIVHTCVLRSK